MGVRIHWKGVAKAAAVLLTGLIALQLAPRLFAAPAPPALPADVGLPRGDGDFDRAAPPEPAAPPSSRFKEEVRDDKGTAIRRRRRSRRGRVTAPRRQPRPEPPPAPVAAESSPTPVAAEPVPEPAPAPAPAAAPEHVAPAPVGDGSEEFAPR